VTADPDRVRLAAEALGQVKADAWTRGDRPSAAERSADTEREVADPVGSRTPAAGGRIRRDDPQPLGAALGGLLSARGWRERAAVGSVFGSWDQIVGADLAAHTRPEAFDDGELLVTADSAAWATQVRLLAPQLIKRLAEELGAGTVRRVKVRGPGAPPRRGRRRVPG
jgi:predicted nucleic acid-binding Zn ribbon protein